MLFIGIDRHSHKSTRVDIKNFFRCSNYVDENDGKNKTKKNDDNEFVTECTGIMYSTFYMFLSPSYVRNVNFNCFDFVLCGVRYIYTDFKLMFNLISNSGKIT